MKTLLFLALLLSLFSGCSTKETKSHSVIPTYKPQKKNSITLALYREYKKWHRTPYKYGGTSLKGVDCSAFIQSVYYDAFGILLPRTTAQQIKHGTFVKRAKLKEGDLLFFETAYKIRHTGILIEKDKFMHTSTKNGVSISSINNPYWRNKYTSARRILHFK